MRVLVADTQVGSQVPGESPRVFDISGKNVLRVPGQIRGVENLDLGRLAVVVNQHVVAGRIVLRPAGDSVPVQGRACAAETVSAADSHAANMKIVLVGVSLGLAAGDFLHA